MPGRVRDPGPGVRDAVLSERLHAVGSNEERAAPSATAASHPEASARRDRSGDYSEWTVRDLRRRAADVGIDGRSTMRRAELIAALRNH